MTYCVSWWFDSLFVCGFAGINFASRQIANVVKPDVLFNINDQGLISMKSITTFKTVEIKFRLDEEFDEITPDDRQAKVHSTTAVIHFISGTFYLILKFSLFQTVLSLIDGKLVQTQKWDGKCTTIERNIQDGKLIVVSTSGIRLCCSNLLLLFIKKNMCVFSELHHEWSGV